MDILSRFALKVLQVESGCHEWQSTIRYDGYGKFWLNGKQEQAHRVAYLLYRGDIPCGAWVLHHCDNRKCVNPEHLYIGTAAQNSQDRSRRLRYACRKLTAYDVAQIRELFALGEWSQVKLADRFGVGQAHISRIVRGDQRVLK